MVLVAGPNFTQESFVVEHGELAIQSREKLFGVCSFISYQLLHAFEDRSQIVFDFVKPVMVLRHFELDLCKFFQCPPSHVVKTAEREKIRVQIKPFHAASALLQHHARLYLHPTRQNQLLLHFQPRPRPLKKLRPLRVRKRAIFKSDHETSYQNC